MACETVGEGHTHPWNRSDKEGSIHQRREHVRSRYHVELGEGTGSKVVPIGHTHPETWGEEGEGDRRDHGSNRVCLSRSSEPVWEEVGTCDLSLPHLRCSACDDVERALHPLSRVWGNVGPTAPLHGQFLSPCIAKLQQAH